jgi:tripartite-type tricarboxylate transporter receptor subunit TctC
MQHSVPWIKRFTAIGLTLFALNCAYDSASAQTGFPARSIRIVVPFAPGGTADILARIVAQQASRSQDGAAAWQFFVENITGGGGIVGAQAAARSAPDGYTLLLCNIACAVGHLLTGAKNWNPTKDIIPVIHVGNVPNILVASPSLGVNSLAEFLALARAKPGKISLASSGPGSSSDLSGILLRAKAHVDLLDVPYRGSGEAIPDILSGRVDAMVMGVPESVPFVRDGKLKGLGVTSQMRATALPDVPTIAQAGVPDYAYFGWLSLFAPAGTPNDIITALNAYLDRVIKSEGVGSAFAKQSIQPGGGPPEVAGDLLEADIELWPSLLQSAPQH